ncbi:MAG: DUF2934 domain-containing protein [Acidobacteriaceae bacterium]
MAEKVKKATAPAKPRTTVTSAKKTKTKTAAVGKPETAKTPSREAIAKLAYRYWKERGGQNGQDWQDWLRAERELKSA